MNKKLDIIMCVLALILGIYNFASANISMGIAEFTIAALWGIVYTLECRIENLHE